MQSLGKIDLRRLAVGAKMGCLYIYFFCRAQSPVNSSLEGSVVGTSIVSRFMGQF